jgi:hypothetical protein
MAEMDELNELIEERLFAQNNLEELCLEYAKSKKIIDCLNALEKIIDQDFGYTLTTDKRDKFVLLFLLKRR